MTAPRMSSKSDFGENEDLSFLASLSADYPDYKRHPEALRFFGFLFEEILVQQLFVKELLLIV